LGVVVPIPISSHQPQQQHRHIHNKSPHRRRRRNSSFWRREAAKCDPERAINAINLNSSRN
jgi:hypothetical protein